MCDMSFSQNSVIARSRAVFGRSLTYEDLARLCTKRSIPEVAEYLRNTPRYRDALSDIELGTIRRRQLEALLDKSLFDTLDSFRRFDLTESRWFFGAIVQRMETDQVLLAIQGVVDGSTDSYITALPAFLIERSHIDLLELGRAQSFSDLDRMLSGTRFGRLLSPLLTEAQASGRINIRECERRLYTDFYLNCMKVIGKSCKGSAKTEMKRVLLRSIDMKNVVTCCRMKAFGFTPQEASEQMLPFRYRLGKEQVEQLMKQPDTDSIARQLAELGFRTDSTAGSAAVEQLTERISLEFFRRTMRLSRNSSTVYFCLIECLENELHNVKTIIEGIRYGVPAKEIMEMLVI